MAVTTHRRAFLKQASWLGASWWILPSGLRAAAPNDKLDVLVIGVAHRGASNLDGVAEENIVGLCDTDANLLAQAAERFPKAKTLRDFRRMDEIGRYDAVVVSTADHTHAPAAATALRLGKHVYCEKPLSHSVYEARVLRKLASEAGVATQMGIQIHAEDNYRRVVELVRGGAIGRVDEVHVWCGKSWSGGERPTETPPVPANLDWDLWLGPAPERPYHPTYQPANWRRWWDFGSGTLGDMACHLMDLPFWALELGSPTRVRAEGPEPHPETTPDGLVVHYEFPRGEGQRPLALTWYDGPERPERIAGTPARDWGMGVLFVGEKGQLAADYGQRVLFPEEAFRDFQPPAATIPTSVGHHREWINGCKTGAATTCDFDYAGNLTEAVLLGNVAFRAGQELSWNAETLEAANCAGAGRYVRREYRPGWTL